MKKIGLICLVLVLAMGMLGAAYASWSQTLTIKEDVYTGEFCMEFGPQTPTVKDTRKPPPVYPVAEPGDADENATKNFTSVTRTLKNVAWGTANYTAGDHPTGLIVTFNDVYPWYYNHIDFWVHYIGSIPGKIDSFVIRNETGIVIETIRALGIYEFDISGDGVPDMQIQWGHPFGDQLHYCDERDISFGFCFLQPLPQDSVITLYLEYVVVQWNEYQP